MSRQGMHRDDKFRVQAYYEAHEKALGTHYERKTMKETYVNVPLPDEIAEKLKRIADANGRRAGREAAQIVIRSVERAKEPKE